MSRFTIAATVTAALIILYAVNAFAAVSVAAAGTAVLFIVIALAMRGAEQDDIARTMAVVDFEPALDAPDALCNRLAS